MSKRIFVGNLSSRTTLDTLRGAIEESGRPVQALQIVTDPRTGRSRGFGFIEMRSEEDAEAILAELFGAEIDGRRIEIHALERGSGAVLRGGRRAQ